MNLYLDDDCVGKVFVHLLRKAGHDLLLPADIGLAGEDDPVHLGHAIETQRVLLSRNYRDFQNLHELILKARGHHPGVLIIRKDQNPKHNLTASGVVRAIANLEAAAISLMDQYVILNQWR